MPSFWPEYENNQEIQFTDKLQKLKVRLVDVVSDHLGSLFVVDYDTFDQTNGAKISMLNDIMNLHNDASLFDHLEQ